MCVLLDRFNKTYKEDEQASKSINNWRLLLLISLFLADKLQNDITYCTTDFVWLCNNYLKPVDDDDNVVVKPVDAKTINQLVSAFVKQINWRLYITPEQIRSVEYVYEKCSGVSKKT